MTAEPGHIIKPYLLDLLKCPHCGGQFQIQGQNQQMVCQDCEQIILLQNNIPIFNQPPVGMVLSDKIARGPGMGTPWRQANWRFVQEQIGRLSSDALILDVGAGRGDFAEVIANHRSIALEVYPYPEIDVVCDLTHLNPFRPACFDAILLLNVLEHIYDTHALLDRLAGLLKPGGVLLVAIPFMVKLHQTPLDFVRYTHYALEQLGTQHGLQVEELTGYYDPVFFLGEGIGNLYNAVLPTLSGVRKRKGQLLVKGILFLADQLDHLLGPGQVCIPAQARSMAPTGYQVVYRKEEVNQS